LGMLFASYFLAMHDERTFSWIQTIIHSKCSGRNYAGELGSVTFLRCQESGKAGQ
jgi:hypothetical protein